MTPHLFTHTNGANVSLLGPGRTHPNPSLFHCKNTNETRRGFFAFFRNPYHIKDSANVPPVTSWFVPPNPYFQIHTRIMTPHLFTGVTSRELGMLRATVFGIWVVILWFSPITSYAALPPALFDPLGIYRLMLGSSEGPIMQIVLREWFLFSLKWALLVGCFLCMIGTKVF